MTLPKWATTPTPLSKAIALVIFITFPIFGFIFGMQYQKAIDSSINVTVSPTPPLDIACTMDAKICPDGSAVGRIPPNCEFSPCPTPTKIPGKFCGGIAGIECPTGYICQYDGNYPDAGGTCVRK